MLQDPETRDPAADLRQRLEGQRGQQFWRSLDELADTPDFRTFLAREFPQGAAEFNDPVSRRTFLKLMGASLALAGLTGCAIRQPQEKIAPYAIAPPEIEPGIPNYYATALTLGGYATGVIVKSHEGRPTKIEGNPGHPASLGGTHTFQQAEILTMYDPDRSQLVLRVGQISTWENFLATLQPLLEVQQAVQGAGLRLLTETVSSPTLAAQIAELQANYPAARWYQYEPVSRDNIVQGAQLAFGEVVETRYNFSAADIVLALDANFLTEGPGHIRYAHDFIARRKVRADQRTMNRLYAIEPTPTPTGMTADHRLPLRAGLVEAATRYVARGLGVDAALASDVTFSAAQQTWLDALVADLQAANGTSIVLAGIGQPPIVHALAHAINAALGNVGTTVEYTDPVPAGTAEQLGDLRQLVDEMNAGQVELLVMIDGNPVYDAPADLNFAGALANVQFSVQMSTYLNETATLATWHIPASHALETWSDARAYDGTVSIVQPLIAPLYDSRTAHELLAGLNGSPASSYDIVRAYWENVAGADDFEALWGSALFTGIVPDTVLQPRDVTLQSGFASAAPATAAGAALEVVFRPDPTVWDGRYANNGWLQELPKPLTTVTWDNPALINPRTAIRLLGLNVRNADNLTPDDLEELSRANGRMVELSYAGRTLTVPVWLMPGQAEESITLSLGYGRSWAGRVGNNLGFNTYDLRTSDAPWFAGGLTLTPIGEQYPIAATQNHHVMEGRHLVRHGTLDQFSADPEAINKAIYLEEYGPQGKPDYLSLLPEPVYTENAWGMTIDLTACIGCGTCTMACQAENNIPIVGKEEVIINREMHWIRIDRYYEGADLDNPETYVQPLACVNCERAPCELVCPVNATVHDSEGINNMIYNRCVGTKYCSNNCPYKVRRFNWFQYTDLTTEQFKMMRNPEVTVRNVGVMEKCTYCIQRISDVRIEARRERRPIADGEIVVACQQACPTNAIEFGDTRDPTAEVARLKTEPHNYTFFDALNVLPRTSYLARIRNANAALDTHAGAPEEE